MTNLHQPAWVCIPCGEQWGHGMPEGHCYTAHIGRCDVCKRDGVAVTEPRDFRWMRAGWEKARD